MMKVDSKNSIFNFFLAAVFLFSAKGMASKISGKKIVEFSLTAYDLTVSKKRVHIGDKSALEFTINGTSPGPVLRFVEGDEAVIHVHNELDVPTIIHWHGLLLPNEMDGVPYLTGAPIPPHQSFTYKFPVRQNGTYWYHSHFGMQEQQGVVGAIVITKTPQKAPADKVIVLSDWTNENPSEIMKTLKRGSEWYSIEKGTAQSLIGAIRSGHLFDYFKRELLRMPPMDISDIAYDYFLANGKRALSEPTPPGQTIRLRLVNAASMTYFYLQFAGGPLKIVAADGQDVQPFQQERLLMAVGETYDVLVRVPKQGAYELRATAQDGSGFASIWIGHGPPHKAPSVPAPDLYATMGNLTLGQVFALTPAGTMGMPDALIKSGHFDKPHSMDSGMAMNMGAEEMPTKMTKPDDEMMTMPNGQKMSMSMMKMPSGSTKSTPTYKAEVSHQLPAHQDAKRFAYNYRLLATDVSSRKNLAVDGMDPRRPWSPYEKLRSLRPTEFSTDGPVQIVRLTLDGDMKRYVWFMNNQRLSPNNEIKIEKGHVARFILINRTMMHHPMHIHGHFFRVLNGQGEYAPLKHTIDVPPMSTVVIEFKADESGDWFFHCHFLYHMESGMARVVHYVGFRPSSNIQSTRSKLYSDPWYAWGDANVLSQMTDGYLTTSDARNILTAEWEAGWNNVPSTEWEGILTYGRYINRYLTVFTGADILRMGKSAAQIGRGIAGISYLLPLNFESRAWMDSQGGARFYLDKSINLTPRLNLMLDGEYDTHDLWYGKVRLAYLLSKEFSTEVEWASDYEWGAGLGWSF